MREDPSCNGFSQSGTLLPLLSGLRVLDLSRNLPGPFATRVLADLGAEIIKIEPPEGDPTRQFGQLFEALNHGKASQRLDFRSPSDIELLREQIKTADIVLSSFRPGVLDALGLSFASMQVLQPKIVLCSITGYGHQGPWAARAGHDLNFMAMSGALDQLRTLHGEQAMSNIQWGDLAGGAAMACITVLAAIFEAQRRGRGRELEISMTHSLFAHLVMPRASGAWLAPLLKQWPQAQQDLLGGALPCYRIYRTADQRWLAVGALELKFWKAACEGLGMPEAAAQHWQLGVLPHSAQSQALIEAVAARIASLPLAAWVARFAGLDACVTPVLTLQEAQVHPLFAEAPRQPWAEVAPS